MLVTAMQINSRDKIVAVAANQLVFVFLLERNEYKTRQKIDASSRP